MMVRFASCEAPNESQNERDETDEAPPSERPYTVAIGMPISESELGSLRRALGPRYSVMDIREAPPDVSVLVVPRCSPGAIDALGRTFPSAQVVVLDLAA
jgi:hypothetical protein